MTKNEVLALLAKKIDANHAEVRRQLEFLANVPGHLVRVNENDGGSVDLLHELSKTWKEGRALQEVVAELVALVYVDEPRPQLQESAVLQ